MQYDIILIMNITYNIIHHSVWHYSTLWFTRSSATAPPGGRSAGSSTAACRRSPAEAASGRRATTACASEASPWRNTFDASNIHKAYKVRIVNDHTNCRLRIWMKNMRAQASPGASWTSAPSPCRPQRRSRWPRGTILYYDIHCTILDYTVLYWLYYTGLE